MEHVLAVTGPGCNGAGAGTTERRIRVSDAPPKGPDDGGSLWTPLYVRREDQARPLVRTDTAGALERVGLWVAPDELAALWWGPVGVRRAAEWAAQRYGWYVQELDPDQVDSVSRVRVDGTCVDGTPWAVELREDLGWEQDRYGCVLLEGGGQPGKGLRRGSASDAVDIAMRDQWVGRYTVRRGRR